MSQYENKYVEEINHKPKLRTGSDQGYCLCVLKQVRSGILPLCIETGQYCG
jgi:hypothetical protein